MLTDLQMLQRYASHGDAHAFRELVQAHGAMVHATALRVTQNANVAEDVAQETFLELARKSGSIKQSVGAWLHRVAWLQACQAVRRERTRRQAEEAMAETWHTDREATWPDIEPYVDEALNELPQELREVLVLYFLEGRTQVEIARHLDRNQATVSRAIERGISAMREALKTRGITCGIGLAALFANQSAHAMPAALQASLGKLSLTSIGVPSSAISATNVAGSTLIAMTTTTKTLLITGTLAAALLPFLHQRPEPTLQTSIAPLESPATSKPSLPLTLDTQAVPAPRLDQKQQATLDRWLRRAPSWEQITHNDQFMNLHEATFGRLIRDSEWKRKLKEAGALARQARGETNATMENTSIHFEFDRIFAEQSDLHDYASALLAGDYESVKELFLSRMWGVAAEQHFRTEPVSQGLNPLPR